MREPTKEKIWRHCMKRQEIRTTLDKSGYKLARIGGWLDGKRSYIRLANANDEYIGSLSGLRLYRLARAIVRHWEADE